MRYCATCGEPVADHGRVAKLPARLRMTIIHNARSLPEQVSELLRADRVCPVERVDGGWRPIIRG